MTHFLNVISKVMSSIVSFSKYYESKGTINRLSSIPDIVTLVGNKGVANNPSIIEENNTFAIDSCICANSDSTSIYICVASGINSSISDIVPIKRKKDNNKYNIDDAIVIYIPYKLFYDGLDFDSVFKILKDMYLSILSMDSNMHYQPDMTIIRLSKSTKVNVPIYDITMMLTVLGAMYINLAQWFGPDNDELLNPNDFLEGFTSKEMTNEQKASFVDICNKYCTSVDNLITSATNGKLVSKFLF